MADITRRVPNCDDGERGKRGKRGHRGPQGPAAPSGPPFWPPFPPDAPVRITIYVRTSGNDDGDGSLTNPLRTFKSAILRVPHAIPPGFYYVIDITDLGIETLPAGYALPPIQGANWGVIFGPVPGDEEWIAFGALTIQAKPRPASGAPVADTFIAATDYTVATDPDTGLVTVVLNTSRLSWTPDLFKGKLLFSSDAGIIAPMRAITGSSSTDLQLADIVISGDLRILEQSAGFESPNGFAADTGAMQFMAVNSIALHGLSFEALDGGPSINMSYAQQPWIEGCDLRSGIITESCHEQVFLNASVVRGNNGGGLDVEGTNITPVRSLFWNVGFVFLGQSNFLLRRSVFDTCPPLATSAVFPGPGHMLTNMELRNSLFRDSTGDAVSTGAGTLSMANVQINNAMGDAIHLVDGLRGAILQNVTGTGNTGFGLHVEDGATARVLDDATDVGEDSGGMKVGVRLPRLWADFRSVVPIKNELDIAVPPTGDETDPGTGGTSLSRVFQRP